MVSHRKRIAIIDALRAADRAYDAARRAPVGESVQSTMLVIGAILRDGQPGPEDGTGRIGCRLLDLARGVEPARVAVDLRTILRGGLMPAGWIACRIGWPAAYPHESDTVSAGCAGRMESWARLAGQVDALIVSGGDIRHIHQPPAWPWLGEADRLAECDLLH